MVIFALALLGAMALDYIENDFYEIGKTTQWTWSPLWATTMLGFAAFILGIVLEECCRSLQSLYIIPMITNFQASLATPMRTLVRHKTNKTEV